LFPLRPDVTDGQPPDGRHVDYPLVEVFEDRHGRLVRELEERPEIETTSFVQRDPEGLVGSRCG
jgi:hypothetical protein